VHELEQMLAKNPNQLQGKTQPGAEAGALPDLSIFDAPDNIDAFADKTQEMLEQVKGIFEEESQAAATILKTWIHAEDKKEEQQPQESA
jgi:flagellar biosynthesis/type III secretory pathway M-ring protein FliF/YscJ